MSIGNGSRRHNKEIPHYLAISVKTVETHRARLMANPGLTSRAALACFALHLGRLDED